MIKKHSFCDNNDIFMSSIMQVMSEINIYKIQLVRFNLNIYLGLHYPLKKILYGQRHWEKKKDWKYIFQVDAYFSHDDWMENSKLHNIIDKHQIERPNKGQRRQHKRMFRMQQRKRHHNVIFWRSFRLSRIETGYNSLPILHY